MAKYFILMGDVIGSQGFDATKLRRQLKSLLSACNGDLKAEILSPYTTALGDEFQFQGIARSLHAAVKCIFYLEEARIKILGKHITSQVHSDVKKRRSFVALLFAAGDLRRLHSFLV